MKKIIEDIKYFYNHDEGDNITVTPDFLEHIQSILDYAIKQEEQRTNLISSIIDYCDTKEQMEIIIDTLYKIKEEI